MPMPLPSWIPLRLLGDRFAANISAISRRDAGLAVRLTVLVPSATYHIRTDSDRVLLGTGTPGDIQPLPQLMSPASAAATQTKLFPGGNYNEPVLIAGEDMGWLLNSLYQMASVIPSAPGHRVPLFFLQRDLERLWVLLHIQDWGKLLADNRVRLFAGEDCVEQFRQSLVEQVMCRWPTLLITIDQNMWPTGITLESCYAQGRAFQNAELARLQSEMDSSYSQFTPARLAQFFRSGRPLRVLGITSRYTTFIQYSLRDWLDAFRQLGHETRMLIETADHELPNNLSVALACAEFHPDLVVAIDHARPELSGVPPKVPVVMWVQDRLPNIYCPEAGRQQSRLDYTIGYSMLELTQRYGYPPSRFMPTMMAANQTRFVQRELSSAEIARYGCEVSFVSNCTMPAEQIVREAPEIVGSPLTARLINGVFQQLVAIYQAGESITSGHILRSMIVQTANDQRINTDIDRVLDLFLQRVNNSLFRHQAIRWIAETGVDLRLYGKGWEQHPEFSKYARGIADNQVELPTIYQASAINLQVTPFGAVHQRLLDGLSAGGFFLMRSVTADGLELILRDMHEWCRANHVRSGSEMVARQDTILQSLTHRYAALGGINPMSRPDYFFGALGECALSGFSRTPQTLWTNSDLVTFSTREQVVGQIEYFLKNPAERRMIAGAMRQRVLETHTYESITRRLLAFMSDDLQEFSQSPVKSAAA